MSDSSAKFDHAPSEYQQAANAYYAQVRSVHSGIYSSRERMAEERKKKRYSEVDPPEIEFFIRNLGTFVEMLYWLCGDGPAVRGIDFGCGSHWFVDYVREEYGWSAVGYDPDPTAIELAKQRFPTSAESYRCRDPLREGLPANLTGTQDFVFCNAVLQHFDDSETDRALAEMARVLRPGGYCMLIFKRWIPELATGRCGLDEPLRVLDEHEGKVMFQDPTMKEAFAKLDPTSTSGVDADILDGWRLFRLFRLSRLLDEAAKHNLLPPSYPSHSAIRYRSGKKMPTACVILQHS